MIAHSDMLNRMLSNNCPNYLCDEDGNYVEMEDRAPGQIMVFTIELHCAVMEVMAKSLGWNDAKDMGEYDILAWRFTTHNNDNNPWTKER